LWLNPGIYGIRREMKVIDVKKYIKKILRRYCKDRTNQNDDRCKKLMEIIIVLYFAK